MRFSRLLLETTIMEMRKELVWLVAHQKREALFRSVRVREIQSCYSVIRWKKTLKSGYFFFHLQFVSREYRNFGFFRMQRVCIWVELPFFVRYIVQFSSVPSKEQCLIVKQTVKSVTHRVKRKWSVINFVDSMFCSDFFLLLLLLLLCCCSLHFFVSSAIWCFQRTLQRRAIRTDTVSFVYFLWDGKKWLLFKYIYIRCSAFLILFFLSRFSYPMKLLFETHRKITSTRDEYK